MTVSRLLARTCAVVGDLQLELAGTPAEPNARATRLGMLERVRERLLHDPVCGEIDAGGKLAELTLQLQLDLEAGGERAERLADAGIPLGNQTVLLRGVNSSVRVIRRLFTELLKSRVRPYYLFQGDVAAGTSHLRTSVETGVEIMQNLRGWISGLAVPHLVIDTPNGMGKVNIGPDYVVSRGRDKWTLRNYEGKLVDYPQPAEIDATCPYDEVYFRDDAR